MGTFFVYILKSAICLASFYLFYKWLLSKETFHRFNRIALLGILFLSLILPCIEITLIQGREINYTFSSVAQFLITADLPVANREAIAQPQSEETPLSWIQIGLMVYFTGIFFFACRNLYSILRMCLLLRSGNREKTEKSITLIVHEQNIAPFSWMKYIVISRKDFEENGREILIHERAHIRNRHSWDLLVADICIILQWFNPAVWLLKRELQSVHEYEADETVLKEGIDAKQYQLLLIKKTVGTRLYSMANSFNHNKLKKRIAMMLKEKSNPLARLKYLYVLPLGVLAVATFSCNSNVGTTSGTKEPVTEAVVEEGIALDTISTFVPQAFLAKRMKEKKSPLVIMDGKEVAPSVVMELPIERIKWAKAIKPLQAKQKYGDKGKDGVLLMDTYSANKILVKGVVRDEKGKPMVNAIAFLDAAGAAHLSDEKGQFTWEAPDNATLSVTAEGYVKQVFKVTPHPVIRLKKK